MCSQEMQGSPACGSALHNPYASIAGLPSCLARCKKRGGLAWYFLRLLPYDVLYNYQNRQLLRRTYRTLRAMLQSLVLRPLGRKP